MKPTDILLDEKLEPKLSNFEYSKMGPPSLSKDLPMEEDEGRVEEKGRQNNQNIQKINTFYKPSPLFYPSHPKLRREDSIRTKDTLRHIAPEYALGLELSQLTDKFNVYSFGVVLLEVLCGRLVRKHLMDLIYWTLECIQEGTINQIIDPYLTGKIAPQCFKIYMDIATSCVRTNGTQRPTIGEVEVGLEHALELQESADMDPGIGGGDQYMYPILQYTGTEED